MHSCPFQQFTGFLDLIALGFLAGVWPVTAPLLAVEFEPDTRSFAFGYRSTEGFDERLNVGEHDGR